MNKLRKIFEGKQTETMGTLEKSDGTTAKPGIETLETLIDTHFPSNTETKPTYYPDTLISLSALQATEIPWITTEILETVFNGFT